MKKFSLLQLRKKLRQLASPAKRRLLMGFFKCAPGEYGAGDEFIGIPIPMLRGIVLNCGHFSFRELSALLNSKIHEERMLALLVLVEQFERADAAQRKRIFNF